MNIKYDSVNGLNEVMLTVNDGPHSTLIPKMLDSLKQKKLIKMAEEIKIQDIIYGIVDSVFDEDTFIINVTETSKDNKYNYGKQELIRIVKIDVSESGSFGGHLDKAKLESTIQGKKIKCLILERDTFGRVVADFSII